MASQQRIGHQAARLDEEAAHKYGALALTSAAMFGLGGVFAVFAGNLKLGLAGLGAAVVCKGLNMYFNRQAAKTRNAGYKPSSTALRSAIRFLN